MSWALLTQRWKIIQNAPRRFCTNLDELGIPAHDLIDLDIYGTRSQNGCRWP